MTTGLNPKDVVAQKTNMNHPCYSEAAHRFYSRIHLPVAPKCNVQCNYCNRKYDCSNESRPGVTSKLLIPEQALERVKVVARRRADLSVVGVAGPGDALANAERTFMTFRLIKDYFPDLLLCLSTNGLNLVEYIDDIAGAGVNHVTVTINTMRVETAKRIYSWVKLEGNRSSDEKYLSAFLSRQQAGIQALASRGVLVKVNSLLMPGVNDAELPILAKKLKLLGVELHNIMPLIAKPEHGSLFGVRNRPEPTDIELEEMRRSCGSIRQMGHCRQCRADAEGRLNNSDAHSPDLFMSGDAIENDNGLLKRNAWRQKVAHMTIQQGRSSSPCSLKKGLGEMPIKIAVCSDGAGFANLDFNEATEFYIYQFNGENAQLLNIRKTTKKSERQKSDESFEAVRGCQAALAARFGYENYKKLESSGVTPVSEFSDIPIEDAIRRTALKLSKNKPLEMQSADHGKKLCLKTKTN